MQGAVSRGSGLQWSRSNTFSQLCLSVAGPLLLKCNHSNLLLWFPIERISHVSAQRRISSPLQSGFGISVFILTCSCSFLVCQGCASSAPPASSHQPWIHPCLALFWDFTSLEGFWGSRFQEVSCRMTFGARAAAPSPCQQQRCVRYSELMGYFEGRNNTWQHLRCTGQPQGAGISLATSQECVYEIVPSLGINWRWHSCWR